MAISYPYEEEVKPQIHCQVLPPLSQTSGRGQASIPALESPPGGFLGRGCVLGLTVGPPPLSGTPGRVQNWILEPAFSAGS